MVAFSKLNSAEQARVRRTFDRAVARSQEQIEADPRKAWSAYLPAGEAEPLLEAYAGDDGLARALEEREWGRAENKEEAAAARTMRSIAELDSASFDFDIG